MDRNTNGQYIKGCTHVHDHQGEKNAHHKLIPPQIRIIRHLAETSNLTQKEIGIMFGVEQATISRIIGRKRWNYGHI